MKPSALGTHTIRSNRLLAELAVAARDSGVKDPSLDDLHRWRRNGLLARPRQIGRRRAGSVSFYRPADLAIGRDVLRSRSLGVRRWRDVRVLAWLHGHDLPCGEPVADLASFAAETVARINHALRTADWATSARGQIPNRPRYRQLVADLVSEMHPDSLRRRLDGARAETLELWEPILSAPSLQEAMQALVHLALESDDEAVVTRLSAIADTVGSALVLDPLVWKQDVIALTGLLSQSDDVLASSVRDAGSLRVEAARFVLRFGGLFVQAMSDMAIASLRSDREEGDLGRDDALLLAGLVDGVIRIGRPRNDADRLVVLLTMLVLDRHHPSFDVLRVAGTMCEFGEEADRIHSLLAAGISPDEVLSLSSVAASRPGVGVGLFDERRDQSPGVAHRVEVPKLALIPSKQDM